jgi:hypothetical protein
MNPSSVLEEIMRKLKASAIEAKASMPVKKARLIQRSTKVRGYASLRCKVVQLRKERVICGKEKL